MEIQSINLQGHNYARNPSNVLENEVPENFLENHDRYVVYSVNKNDETNSANVNVTIGIRPNDPQKGVVDYKAVYIIKVKGISYKDNTDEEIVDFAIKKSWSRIHADYVKAFDELNLPTSGFPPTPVTSKSLNE